MSHPDEQKWRQERARLLAAISRIASGENDQDVGAAAIADMRLEIERLTGLIDASESDLILERGNTRVS